MFDLKEKSKYSNTMAKATTDKKLSKQIRGQIIEVMREVLSDPEAGLEVTPEFGRKLKQSIKAEAQRKTTPLEKIFEQYGI